MPSLQRDTSSQKRLHTLTWTHILNVFVVELVVESLFDDLLLLGDFVQSGHLHASDHHLEEREGGRHVRLQSVPPGSADLSTRTDFLTASFHFMNSLSVNSWLETNSSLKTRVSPPCLQRNSSGKTSEKKSEKKGRKRRVEREHLWTRFTPRCGCQTPVGTDPTATQQFHHGVGSGVKVDPDSILSAYRSCSPLLVRVDPSW